MPILRAVAGCTLLFAAACGNGSGGASGGPDGGIIDINKHPTGSITTPSLCERTELDYRVAQPFIESFAYLWASDHYLLVYADSTTGDIYSVKMSKTGAEQGTAVLVEQTPGKSSLPSLIATSGGYVVAWQDDGAMGSVHVHSLDADGNPTGGSHTIAMTRSSQVRPSLSASPMGLAISWMDQAAASLTNVTDVGTSTTWLGLLDSNLDLRTDVPAVQLDAANQSGYPWLAGDGKSLSLLYSDSVAGRTDVYYSPVSPTLGTTSADVRGPTPTAAALIGRLDKTDFGFIASWEDHRSGEAEIYMSLLDPMGTRFAGGLVEEPMTGNANWPHQAWTGSSAGVVYYQFRSGKPQVFMTFIDSTGARIGGGADTQISNTPAQAKYPDIQWDGSTFGILWLDTRNGDLQHETLYFNSATCNKPAPI